MIRIAKTGATVATDAHAHANTHCHKRVCQFSAGERQYNYMNIPLYVDAYRALVSIIAQSNWAPVKQVAAMRNCTQGVATFSTTNLTPAQCAVDYPNGIF